MSKSTKTALALSVEEAGRRLGLGRASAYAAVRRGEIPSIRIGKRLVIPLVQLERWLAEGPKDRRPRRPSPRQPAA